MLQEYDKTEKDEITDLIKGVQWAHLIVSRGSGLSLARNEGLEVAKGTYVMYWDDDIRIGPEVFPKLVQAMRKDTFDCFTAKEVPVFKVPLPKWFDPSMVTQSPKGNEFYIHGSFMGIKRALLHELGGFSPQFGPVSSSLGYGDDTLVEMKCRIKGCRMGYLEDIHYLHDKSKYVGFRKMMEANFKKGKAWLAIQLYLDPKSNLSFCYIIGSRVYNLICNVIDLILFTLSLKNKKRIIQTILFIFNHIGGVSGAIESKCRT